jgi:hypothetical protein
VRGRAARGGPARLRQRVLQPRPIAFPLAQQHHLRPRGEQPAAEVDQGDRELCGKVPLGGVAHPPSQREGSAFRDNRDHQRRAPAAHTAAIQDEHQRLQGEMPEPDIRIGENIHLFQEVGVVHPPGKAFDTARGLGAIGHLGGDGGQLRALAAHDAADERGEGLHMSGEVPGRRRRIGVHEGVADGTIPAKVVTRRPFLLLLVSGGIYDEPTYHECLSGKNMEAIGFNELINMSQRWESVR